MSEAVRGTGQGSAASTDDIKAVARFALREKGGFGCDNKVRMTVPVSRSARLLR